MFPIIPRSYEKRRTVAVCTLLIGLTLYISFSTFEIHSQETRRLGINTTLRDFSDEAKSIQELGVRTIRVPLAWQFIRIRPGEYDWSTVDRFVKTAQAKQIEVLFNLRTTSQEETKKSRHKRGTIKTREIHPPFVNREQWLHFVETLANRYRGQGIHYEIENEVNREASWKGTQEEYLELLRTGYDLIKKADPRAKVLHAAMGCGKGQHILLGSSSQEGWKGHDPWLQPIFSAKQFDVVNVHNYYFPSDPLVNGMTFRSYLEHIHDLMRKFGLGNRPIWITEIGYISIPMEGKGRQVEGSPEKQAHWLKEAYQQAFEFGAERIFWCFLRDQKDPYFGSMGLMDVKGNPRPAWETLKQFK